MNGEPPRSEPRPSARGQPSESRPSATGNTTPPPPQHHQETPPIPPRWRRVKRTLLAASIALIALLCLRLAWGCEADRRLRAKITEYRAAGEPPFIEDFARSPIPDEDNAASYYAHHHDALVIYVAERTTKPNWMSQELYLSDVSGRLGYHVDEMTSRAGGVGALFEDNVETHRLIRYAQTYSL